MKNKDTSPDDEPRSAGVVSSPEAIAAAPAEPDAGSAERVPALQGHGEKARRSQSERSQPAEQMSKETAGSPDDRTPSEVAASTMAALAQLAALQRKRLRPAGPTQTLE